MSQRAEKRVTLEDVARDAGVSRSTASLVLRGNSVIPEETAQRVFSSMKKLGYVYDRVAANLRSRTSSAIGVIITEISNPYYAELLIGIQGELDKKSLTVLLGITFDSRQNQNRVLETMLENRVSGIIMCPVVDTDRDIIGRVLQMNIPLVFVSRELRGMDCDFVGTDFIPGEQQIVRHLVERGHKRIALLCGSKNNSVYEEKLGGYRKALEENRVPYDDSLVINGPHTREGGFQAVLRVLELPDRPTAIICYNDLVAIGAINGMRSVGLEPGRDIAVVGHDNIPEAKNLYPSLTTLALDVRSFGREAASLIHSRINGLNDPPQRIILPNRLIIRDSSSAVANSG
jgi:LacI family transcriptional regulator